TQYTETVNIGRCWDILLGATTKDAPCSSIDDFIKCLIQELQLFKTRPSQMEITNVENIVKRNLANSGLHCRVNVRSIILRIQHEEERGVTFATRRPTGFSDATTTGDCLNALTILNTAAEGVDCRLVAPFFKCIIKVTEYYKFIRTPVEDSSLLKKVQNHLGHLLVYCTVDIPALTKEVSGELTTPAESVTSTTAADIFTTKTNTTSAKTKTVSTPATVMHQDKSIIPFS
ncbi:unnamed protein product, partial [Candidula unifasciata]